MPKRLITYLMSGPAHLPYLVASLSTLRDWAKDATVQVVAWPESHEVVSRMCGDVRLGVDSVVRREPEYRGHCDQFLDKLRLVQSVSGYDSVLYLDADTTVHGPLTPLFEAAERCGFAATQFCDWTMRNGIPRSRVAELLKFPEVPECWVRSAVGTPSLPSVNGGVWAAVPESAALDSWRRWTEPCLSLFIADERVLHVVVAKYRACGYLGVLNGRYNCSPKYQPAGLPDAEVVIRHYHGDSNVRPDKSPYGWELWAPIWRACLDEDLGGCRDWWRGVGNKWMGRLAREGLL